MKTLLDVAKTSKPSKPAAPKVAISSTRMKQLDAFRREHDRDNKEINKIVQEMLDAGFKLT